ncbi:MAG TPA: hypothetical protein ENJ56_07590, partial [Anaerolineae bacterium]|nr:hypothetical protein [Anaerolineae bacterium]
MNDKEVLQVLESIIRSMPSHADIVVSFDEYESWTAEVEFISEYFSTSGFVTTKTILKQLTALSEEGKITVEPMTVQQRRAKNIIINFKNLRRTLKAEYHRFRFKTLGPTSIAIGEGRVFDYFEEITNIFSLATENILIIDPYLDLEFISRYIGSVSDDVSIRLLCGNRKLKTLIPAVEAYTKQDDNISISVRKNEKFHDRYVIIDQERCF